MTSLKKHTVNFINELERIAQTVDPKSFVEDSAGRYNEKEYLEGIIAETRNLIKHGEWFVGLEMAIDNLWEVEYKLDNAIVNLAEFVFRNITSEDSQHRDSFLETLNSMRK